MSDSQESKQDPAACPHWGKGGRYARDPITGERTLVKEQIDEIQTADAAPPAASEESAGTSSPAKKGK